MAPRPLLVRIALAVVRLAGLIVPRRDRTAWRQEWTGEVLHAHDARTSATLETDMTLFRRSLGSIIDAAWLRRQFTRDSELVHDITHGLRVMRRQPVFAALAVVILGIGIGSATAMSSVADHLFLRALPYPQPDTLVAVWQNDTATPAQGRGEVAPANFLDWRERSRSFETIAAVQPYSMDFTGGDRPEVWFGSLVSEGFFDALRLRPLHGRVFTADDYVAGRHQVAIISHGLWQRRFGADAGVVGRAVPLDGAPYTIVGVLPPDFELSLLESPGAQELWTPKIFQDSEKQRRGAGWWAVVGRLAQGVTLAAAQADLDRVSQDIARENPRTNKTTVAAVEPLVEHLIGDGRSAIGLLSGAVLLVLLIACANVANMLLARAADRDREFAVRSAIGAGRPRLVRQQLTETGLLAVAGAGVGVGIASLLLNVMRALAPRDIPRLASVTVDWRIALFAVGAALITAVLAGLVPALQYSRPKRAESLAAGRGTTASRRARWLGDALAVAEISLAVALVLGASLLLRSFSKLLAIDPGFRTQNVLALQVFAWDRQDTPAKVDAFFRDTLADLRTLPGVLDVGAVSAMPLISANINIQGAFTVEGRPPLSADQANTAFQTMATPGYFGVMGIRVLQGRTLDSSDDGESEPVVVISQALARAQWPGTSPVDAFIHLRVGGQPRRARVVGVVSELRHDGLELPAREEIFIPHAQNPFGSMTYVVRTANDPRALADSAKQAIWKRDSLLTFYETTTVEGLVSASVAPRRFSLVLVGVFAAAALLLAAAGVYGVLSFTTERRMREFGLRVALGAGRREIAGLVVGRGLALGLAGLGAGLVLALLTAGSLRSALFQVSPQDPLTIAAVSVGVLATSVMACLVPARRAMRVDPIAALRE